MHLFLVQVHISLIIGIQTMQYIQQCTFSSAVFTKKGVNLSFLDSEVYIIEYTYAREVFGDILKFYSIFHSKYHPS